jgi:hypothetical protein
MSSILLTALFLEMGLALVVIPWSTFWDRNYFVDMWPAVRELVANHFVRGAVSGLGVVNLAAAVAELVGLFARRQREPIVSSIVQVSDETGQQL